MPRLWPPADPERGPLTAAELAHAYAYPPGLTEPYLRVNFVSSADGAVAVGGKSAALGSDADRRVFGLLRQLCEVVVVGAGTVRAENYRGVRRPSRVTGVPPPVAVVTGTAELDPSAPLFTDTRVPPIVLTGRSSPPGNRERLRSAGAEVVVLDTDRPDPAGIRAELHARGLRRVLCEGGPGLFGELIAADAVDELCLTVSPLLVVGDAGRISRGPVGEPRRMRLVGVLAEDDVLLLRYVRDR